MNPLRLLIIDCYSKLKQQEFTKNRLKMACQLYQLNISNILPPNNFTIKYLFPGNENFTFPKKYDYDGAIFTGSSYSVYDNNQDVIKYKKILDDLIENEIDCFGSCFGLQLFANQLGGKVIKSPKSREIGIARNIKVIKKIGLYKDKSNYFNAVCSHQDSVIDVSKYGEILTMNNHSIQSVKFSINNSTLYGVQYHPEYNLEYLGDYLNLRKDKLLKENIFKDRELLESYIIYLQNIHKKHIFNKYDILNIFNFSDDLMNDYIRTLEIRNWIRIISNKKYKTIK